MKIVKRIIVSIVAIMTTIVFTGCSLEEKTNNVSFQFEEKKIDENYSYLIDKQNGVMYLKFQVNQGIMSCALSVLLNPDGTPKKWEGYE